MYALPSATLDYCLNWKDLNASCVFVLSSFPWAVERERRKKVKWFLSLSVAWHVMFTTGREGIPRYV